MNFFADAGEFTDGLELLAPSCDVLRASTRKDDPV